MLAIRPYRPDDLAAVNRLMFQTGAVPTETMLVACDGGVPVGFGSLWRKRAHPFARYISLGVHPANRRQGIGSALLAQLGALDDTALPLIASCWESSRAGLEFLQAHGFTEMRRTWTHLLELNRVDADAYPAPPEGYAIRSLAELDGAPGQELIALCRWAYTETHLVNPPAPDADWAGLIRQDLLAAGSFVAVADDGTYAAFSLMHGPDDDNTLLLGWHGVVAGHPERDLMLALTLRQVAYGVEHGHRLLEAEIDSTDPWALMQAGALPFKEAPGWVTFRRPA